MPIEFQCLICEDDIAKQILTSYVPKQGKQFRIQTLRNHFLNWSNIQFDTYEGLDDAIATSKIG